MKKSTSKKLSEARASNPLPNPVTIALGQNLRKFRNASGKTQEVLAFNAEVERSRISKIESGLVNPSLLTLATICHALKITLPILFGGITATQAPVSEGGIKRRSNQATLEKPFRKVDKVTKNAAR